MKLLSTFKKLIDFSLSKEKVYRHEAGLLALACSDGDIEKVKQYNKKENYFISHVTCIKNAVDHSQTQVYIELMQNGAVRENVNLKKIETRYLFFEMAAYRGNIDLIKYMLSDEHPYFIDLNSDYGISRILDVFHNKHTEGPQKVIQYLIYEKNYNPSLQVKELMKIRKHEDILDMINKRDFYHFMQQDIKNKNTNSQRKKI